MLSREAAPESEIEWRVRRKAKPCEEILPTTATWCAGLPLKVQPKVLLERFPRILRASWESILDRVLTARKVAYEMVQMAKAR